MGFVAVGRLAVGAVLVGGGGVGGGAVFAGGHPLVYPVQAARLLEVANLLRGREPLNGCRGEERRRVVGRTPRTHHQATTPPQFQHSR